MYSDTFSPIHYFTFFVSLNYLENRKIKEKEFFRMNELSFSGCYNAFGIICLLRGEE